MKQWFVSHTQPLKEIVAQIHLLEQGYEVYLPRFKKLKKHARKVEEVLSPLFPRYIFICMDISTTQWRQINGTRGISYLLTGSSGKPSFISTKIIESLKAQEEAPGVVPLHSVTTLCVGDKVLLTEGMFKDQLAVLEKFTDTYRVQVLLSLLGKDVRLSVSLTSV